MPARSTLLMSLALLASVSLAVCSAPGTEELAAAREALGRGRYSEAIEHYTEVTIQAPGSPQATEALYELALIHYLKRRDLGNARSTLRKLLTLYPDADETRDARRVLARMYEQDLGQPEKAIEEYEALLAVETDNAERKNLLLSIGNCWYGIDGLEQAARAYRRMIREFPYGEGSATAHLRLAHIELLEGRLEESLDTIDRLLAHAEDLETRRKAYLIQVEALGALGEFEEAYAILERAEEEMPGDAELADLGSRLHEHEKAQRSVATGDELEPVRWSRGRLRKR